MTNRFTLNHGQVEEARAAIAGRAPAARADTGSWSRGVFTWLLFLGLAAVILFMLRRHGHSARDVGSDAADPVAFHRGAGLSVMAVGVVLFVLAWFFMIRRFRLQDPFTADKSEAVGAVGDGICIVSGDGVRRELTWPYFEAFVETPRLLVLRERRTGRGRRDVRIKVVPKDAFPTAAERDNFRASLHANLPVMVLPAGGAGDGTGYKGGSNSTTPTRTSSRPGARRSGSVRRVGRRPARRCGRSWASWAGPSYS